MFEIWLLISVVVAIGLLLSIWDWRNCRELDLSGTSGSRLANPTLVYRYMSKPLPIVLAIVAVLMYLLTVDLQARGVTGLLVGTLILFGLLFSLAGDIFLLFERFLGGLITFGLAHLSCIFAFLLFSPLTDAGYGIIYLLAALIIAHLLGGILYHRIGKFAGGFPPGEALPGRIYATVLAWMFLISLSTLNPFAILGGLLFLFSDYLLSLNKYSPERRENRTVVMITCHLAQWMFVAFVIFSNG